MIVPRTTLEVVFGIRNKATIRKDQVTRRTQVTEVIRRRIRTERGQCSKIINLTLTSISMDHPAVTTMSLQEMVGGTMMMMTMMTEAAQRTTNHQLLTLITMKEIKAMIMTDEAENRHTDLNLISTSIQTNGKVSRHRTQSEITPPTHILVNMIRT